MEIQGTQKMRLFKYFGLVRNNTETCGRQNASNYDILELRALLNSVALVRTRTIPTERLPPVGEVSANFCGERGVTWSAQRVPTAVNLCFLDLEPLLFSFK